MWYSERKLFVVSKVAAEHKTYEDAKASIDKTLSDIGLDYLDMMIIHSPQPWVEVNQSDDRYVEGNRAAWKALEEAYKEGKLKAIGVSNFQIGDIESLLETCEIKPMVNQILLHISNTPLELVEYCQKKGIAVEAYSRLLMARFYTSRRLPIWLKNTEYLFHSFASVIHCSSVRFHFLKPVIRNI